MVSEVFVTHAQVCAAAMAARVVLTHVAAGVRPGVCPSKNLAASRWCSLQLAREATRRDAAAAAGRPAIRDMDVNALNRSSARRPLPVCLMHSSRSTSFGGATLFREDSLRQPIVTAVPATLVAPAAAASSRRHLHATTSPRGLFSSVGDTYQKMKLDKEVAQASEAFALTLKSLVDLGRPMDADAYLAIVQEGKAAAGLDGWRASLPWVASSAAVAEVTEVEKMIAAMTPAERRQVRLLGGAGTRRVAEAAGVEAAKVEGMVKNVQTMQVLQKWLRKRKASGRALPTSRKELLVMMAAPGSGATMHMHAQRGT